MIEPTESDVEQLLTECWEIAFDAKPGTPTRMVVVDHLLRLADVRGYSVASVERLAGELVRRRHGSRSTISDPARTIRNIGRRLLRRAEEPAKEIWVYSTSD